MSADVIDFGCDRFRIPQADQFREETGNYIARTGEVLLPLQLLYL